MAANHLFTLTPPALCLVVYELLIKKKISPRSRINFYLN